MKVEDINARLRKAKCWECHRKGGLEVIAKENGEIHKLDDETPFIRCQFCGWEWWANLPKGFECEIKEKR